MALLFCDGFGHIEDGYESLKYDIIGSASYVYYESTTGSLGGYGIRIDLTDAAYITKNLPSNKSTIIIGFRGKFELHDSTDPVMRIKESGTTQAALYYIGGGKLRIVTGGNTYDTAPGLIQQYTWRYIEVKILFSQTVGTVEVRVDGVTVINETGIDTCATTNEYCDAITLQSNDEKSYFDDFYICDTAGSLNNDFLGDIKITTLYPTSDGNSSDFTPSTGTDHFALVDDPQLSSDTDHNESSTVGHKDSYGMSTLSGSDTIKAVQISGAVKNTDTGTMVVKLFCRSGATPADNEGDSYVLSQTYKAALTIFEQEPTDVVAWTQAKINSAEFGIKVES